MMSFIWLLLGALLALVFFALGAHQRDKMWSTALKLPRAMQPQELLRTHNVDLHLRCRISHGDLIRSRIDCEFLRKESEMTPKTVEDLAASRERRQEIIRELGFGKIPTSILLYDKKDKAMDVLAAT